MKFIKNYLLGGSVFFGCLILFHSSGNTQDDLNIQETETRKISRESKTLLQDKPINNDNIFFGNQTENLDLGSINIKHFSVRLRTPNTSHSDDYFDFYQSRGAIIEYRWKFDRKPKKLNWLWRPRIYGKCYHINSTHYSAGY
ncbi:MAG: hypothetical protein AAGA16_18110 [Cyanobacteria bacterium P01_E01_bin.35]